MGHSIGVDIGGTFTDCVVVDAEGRRHLSKALTVPGELERGVLDALDVNAAQQGLTRGELLAATDRFVHSTTQATNAILTRTGARTGLITTRGHEQTLVIGNVYAKVAGLPERDVVHTSRLAKPAPVVPRELVVGVHERVDRDGDVVVALSDDDAVAAIDTLIAAGVEAIAVSLLWSFLHPAHEVRIKELIAERAPGVFAAFSHEIAPVMGEYERTVTTALTAYVGPTVAAYLGRLEAALTADGLRTPMLVMQASGGLTSVADAAQRPLVTLDSGPTGGVLGCRFLGSLGGRQNLICTDVGGTSFDVGLVLDGQAPLDPVPVISQYVLRMPKVRVESIGAGGGSIAWVDRGGLLRVGPQSARSVPGPACYGRGGTEPTVTDADLVLGHIDPDSFLGGRMPLRRDLALDALERLGKQLGRTAEETAIGISTITNAHMADLIRRTTVELGHDPRECSMVAYGGAGPTHAAGYARTIGALGVIVPADSTVFSAEGVLTCDVTHTEDSSTVVRGPFGPAEMESVVGRLRGLERRVLARFAAEGVDAGAVDLVRTVGMRYGNQVHSFEIAFDGPDGEGEDTTEAGARRLVDRFFDRYRHVYGAGALMADFGIELELHRVTGTQVLPPLDLARADAGAPDPTAARSGTRRAWFEQTGFAETAVYAGDRLRAGHVVEGPALIERMGDTVLVPPDATVEVDAFANLTLTLRETAPLGDLLLASEALQ